MDKVLFRLDKSVRYILHHKKVLNDFLVNVLKVTAEQAEIDACKTEHLISVETATKLQAFIEAYQANPSKAA